MPPDPAELSLLVRLRNGDAGAFVGLYDLYAVRLRLVAWRISRRPDWLDDLTNETWRRAYEARATFDTGRPFLVWLSGILRNVFREQLRTWQQDPTAAAMARDADGLDPARLAAEADFLAALDDCVSRLPEDDQTLVRWRFFEGLTLRAIAQRMGLPEATLRESRLANVLDGLRKCLQTKGIEPDAFFSAQTAGPAQFTLRDGDS